MKIKPIKLPRETIKAIMGGASKIVLGVDEQVIAPKYLESEVVKEHSPLQPNEEYYVVEFQNEWDTVSPEDNSSCKFKCVSVEVKKKLEVPKLCNWEKSDDYIFLAQIQKFS